MGHDLEEMEKEAANKKTLVTRIKTEMDWSDGFPDSLSSESKEALREVLDAEGETAEDFNWEEFWEEQYEQYDAIEKVTEELEDPITYSDAFTEEFMQEYTDFNDYDEFLEAYDTNIGSGISGSIKNFINNFLSLEEYISVDKFVKKHTEFSDMHEMTVTGTAEYLEKRDVFDEDNTE